MCSVSAFPERHRSTVIKSNDLKAQISTKSQAIYDFSQILPVSIQCLLFYFSRNLLRSHPIFLGTLISVGYLGLPNDFVITSTSYNNNH